jgi:hypothetical protein
MRKFFKTKLKKETNKYQTSEPDEKVDKNSTLFENFVLSGRTDGG